MNVLLIGGTGLISTGIVKHLRLRGAAITMFNRGQREDTTGGEIEVIHGDRNDPESLAQCTANGRRWDVVIDMICFNPDTAAKAIHVFAGECQQYIFCSTVCTYGTKIPPGVLVDETFPHEPISKYGREKVACEQAFMDAHKRGDFKATIVRPSHTYGPGSPLIDNLEGNAVAWDRIAKGKPILCAGDGLGLWVSTYRDDVGKLFAHACLNEKTYGQSYNATRDEQFTWRDYLKDAASVVGKPADVVFMPAEWIASHDPARFGLLREITAFHGPYSSAKAKRDVPEFVCEVDFVEGARKTLDDVKRRNAWRDSGADAVYDGMIARALSIGVKPITL